MAYTILDLKTDLQGILHGTSLSKVQGVLPVINRAGRELLLDADTQETKRTAQIAGALYDNVNDYTAPSDLKGGRVIDLRPQVDRGLGDNFRQTYSEEFDLKKLNNTFQVRHNSGVKTLRIAKDLSAGILLHEMDSIAGNGTWAATVDAGNLTLDTLQYVTGSGSLNFDLDGNTTSGVLTNSTITPVDLSDHEDRSAIFVWVYLPLASAITSIDLKWGDSAAAYWNRTVTTGHNEAFKNGWNLLRYDWDGATQTGSPDASSVNYLSITITYDGTADTDFRIDSIYSRQGDIFEIVYYSNFLFKDGTTSALKELAEDDSDIVILEPEARNLLLYKVAELISQQVQGEDSGVDLNYFRTRYLELLNRYKTTNKSEAQKLISTYYTIIR